MKRRINTTLIGLLIPVVFAILANLPGCYKSSTPMDRYIEYLESKHNDNCQYEQGECPEELCRISEPPTE